MALFNELPVYKTANELLVTFLQYSPNITKFYRYTISEKVVDMIIEVMACLFRANRSREEKTRYLILARETFVKVIIEVRLLYDLNQLTRKQYIILARQCDEISKQLASWYNVKTI